jgi:hypothetical protein
MSKQWQDPKKLNFISIFNEPHKAANKMQWANDVTLEKDCMSFYQKIIFPYKRIYEKLFLQIFVISAYNYPSIGHDFFSYKPI